MPIGFPFGGGADTPLSAYGPLGVWGWSSLPFTFSTNNQVPAPGALYGPVAPGEGNFVLAALSGNPGHFVGMNMETKALTFSTAVPAPFSMSLPVRAYTGARTNNGTVVSRDNETTEAVGCLHVSDAGTITPVDYPFGQNNGSNQGIFYARYTQKTYAFYLNTGLNRQIAVSDDGGLTWDSTGATDWPSTSVPQDFFDSPTGRLFAVYTASVFYSDNGGANWVGVASGGAYRAGMALPSGRILLSKNLNDVTKNIAISDDDGLSYTDTPTFLELLPTLTSRAVEGLTYLSDIDSVIGFFGTAPFISRNGGASWQSGVNLSIQSPWGGTVTVAPNPSIIRCANGITLWRPYAASIGVNLMAIS